MDVYRENILDHYKNPRNFGRLENPSVTTEGANPLCGDSIVLDLKVSGGFVSEVAFHAVGCAISISSASMLSDSIRGKSIEDIERISKEDVLAFFGKTLTAGRAKCALLSYNALKEALRKLSH